MILNNTQQYILIDHTRDEINDNNVTRYEKNKNLFVCIDIFTYSTHINNINECRNSVHQH